MRDTLAGIPSLAVLAFLFANIEQPGTGSAYGWLIVAATSVLALLLTRIGEVDLIRFPVSLLWLVIFLIVLMANGLVDLPNIGELKAMLISTSGGIVFAWGLGSLLAVALLLANCTQRKGYRAIFWSVLILAAAAYLSVSTLSSHLQSVRTDIFLVGDIAGKYQRPGDFAIIVSLMVALEFACLHRSRSGSIALTALAYSLYCVTTLTLMAVCQLLGSNKGLAVIAGILVVTSVWMLRPNNVRQRYAVLLLNRPVSPLKAVSERLPQYTLAATTVLVSGVAAVFLIMRATGIEAEHLRIFGFASGQFGGNSIASRLEIFGTNFLAQWSINPLFGHLRADEVTTGAGTYVHSLISVVSHVGLLGGAIIIVLLCRLYGELNRVRGFAANYHADLELAVLRMALFTVVLLFALIAAFFTWMPLWFAIGLLCPPIIFSRVVGTLLRARTPGDALRDDQSKSA